MIGIHTVRLPDTVSLGVTLHIQVRIPEPAADIVKQNQIFKTHSKINEAKILVDLNLIQIQYCEHQLQMK